MRACPRMPSRHGVNTLTATSRAFEHASRALDCHVAGESVNHHINAALAIEACYGEHADAVLSHIGEVHRRAGGGVAH